MERILEFLPLIVGIAVVAALLRSSSRRRFGRGRNRRARGRAIGTRFPREVVPGRVVRVTDGDGLLVDVVGFGRLNVRLAYIDAPEHDQPWGPQSKAALARLLRGARVRLRLLYRDRYARTVAVVLMGETVLNEQMVRGGHAWVYQRYVPARKRVHYAGLEREARSLRAGLWGAQARAVPPWEWRNPSPAGLFVWLAKLVRRFFGGR